MTTSNLLPKTLVQGILIFNVASTLHRGASFWWIKSDLHPEPSWDRGSIVDQMWPMSKAFECRLLIPFYVALISLFKSVTIFSVNYIDYLDVQIPREFWLLIIFLLLSMTWKLCLMCLNYQIWVSFECYSLQLNN